MLVVCCVTSHDVVRGLMEAQEEFSEEGINYVAMRNLFVREAREAMDVTVEKKTRTTHIRESAEKMELSKMVKALCFFCGLVSIVMYLNVSHEAHT